MTPRELNDKVTELAKVALEKGDGKVMIVVLLLWGLWLAFQNYLDKKRLQDALIAASMARLDAQDQLFKARIRGIDEKIAEAVVEVKATQAQYLETEKHVEAQLLAAEETKARIAKLKNWEDLDALAQGR